MQARKTDARRIATWHGPAGVVVLESPEPGRLVLLAPTLFAELEPIEGGARVLWASDRRLLASEILDDRALEATAKALSR